MDKTICVYTYIYIYTYIIMYMYILNHKYIYMINVRLLNNKHDIEGRNAMQGGKVKPSTLPHSQTSPLVDCDWDNLHH